MHLGKEKGVRPVALERGGSYKSPTSVLYPRKSWITVFKMCSFCLASGTTITASWQDHGGENHESHEGQGDGVTFPWLCRSRETQGPKPKRLALCTLETFALTLC
jgi:hypothetical protein